VDEYTISFDAVLLHASFGPADGPVYLFMSATVYDPADPTTALWSGSVGGSSPNDANIPADPASTGRDGLFSSSSLQPGVQIRHDDPDTKVPMFAISSVPIEAGQRLRFELVLAPEVWFTQVHQSADPVDAAVLTGFFAAWGSAAGGPAGAAVAAIFSGLFSWGGSDVDVPCFNPILLEQHEWDAAGLRRLSTAGAQEFGPTGAQPSYGCPQATASYWLSIQAVPQFATDPRHPCTLLWIGDERVTESFEGTWGDYGIIPSDQVNAWVNRDHTLPGEVYDVRLRERQTASRDVIAQSFRGVPVTEEFQVEFFTRNWYEFVPFGYHRVVPVAHECSAFSNVNPAPPWIDDLYALHALVEVANTWRRRTHAEELPIAPSLDRTRDLEVAAGGVGLGDEPIHLAATEDVDDVRDEGSTSFRPTPARRIRSGPMGAGSRFGRYLAGAGTIRPGADLRRILAVRVLRLTPALVLMLYGELHGGRLLQTRLRYLRSNEQRSIRTDVLLRPTHEPPR
jgi:hypothetical protein